MSFTVAIPARTSQATPAISPSGMPTTRMIAEAAEKYKSFLCLVHKAGVV